MAEETTLSPSLRGPWAVAGAVAGNNGGIAHGCMAGAGAVAMGDIVRSGTCAGVPAVRIGGKANFANLPGGQWGQRVRQILYMG